MSITKSILFDEVCQRGSIRDVDVQELRKQFYEDGAIAVEEANAVFEINDACRVQDPAWQIFFNEAITDYLVENAEPRGYLSAENADWLIERITHDGVLHTPTELNLVLNVLDKARWSPESLVRFALNTVKDAILMGESPLRQGEGLEAGVVNDADVELLRRAIYAYGGCGHFAVTRAEAEILFEINDATAAKTQNAAWTELFVKAILNVVMSASGYNVPSREEALAREDWLQSRGDLSLGNIVAGMFGGGLSGFFALYTEQSDDEREIARLERQRVEIITNEEVTGDEAAWLIAQINRDGELTFNECALLMHLQSSGAKVHPALQPLADRASAEA